MSDVSFGVKGKVSNGSINVKTGDGKNAPYTFADFSVDSYGHKLKVKVGGSKPKNMYVYDFDEKKTEKIDYVKDFVSKKKKANLIGVKYTTIVDETEETGIKCEFDFANSISDIITDDTYEIYGKIDFRRYEDNGNMKVTKELKLSSIHRSKDEEELHHFDVKNFLFTGMSDKKFAEGFILGYKEIIPVRLEVGNEGLAETLSNKKMVKPYTLMTVIGEISNKPEVEEPKKADVKKGNWGEVTTSYGMVKNFSFMKMTILKVDPSTLNHGVITEKILAGAIKKTNEVDDQYNAPVKDAKWGNEEKTPDLKKGDKEVGVEDKTKIQDEEVDEVEPDEDDSFDWDDE